MELIKLKDMELGRSYDTYVMLNSITQKTTKTGSDYLEMNISDGDTEVIARMFNTSENELGFMGIYTDSIIRVSINANLYNSFRNYTITNIEANDDEAISYEDFIRKAPIDIDDEFEYLIYSIEKSHIYSEEDYFFEPITVLATRLLTKYRDEFKRAPAAKTIHHNVIGGLLYHTVSMVRQAEKIMENYPNLDRELLICGIALHDIGKLHEMETNQTGHTEYTSKGRLLGHTAIGVMMVSDAAKGCNCINERVMMLEHMIASHHGKLEFGAIIAPAIPEATVLHALDMIDSRVYIYNNEYENMKEGSLSGNISPLENSQIYKPCSSFGIPW